jgi:alcohol dehydrogenase (cytochrome c)
MGRRRRAVIVVVAVGVALAAATAQRGNANRTASIPTVPAFTAAQLSAPAGDDWITNGGSVTNERYSALDKINKSNVGKLKLAWQIHLHSGGTRAYSQEATPVVYKGVMYISTGNDDVFALDAATGKQLWVWHSHVPVAKITTACCGFSNRGVAIGDGKVFIALITGQLVALDQQTGGVVWRTWNTRW